MLTMAKEAELPGGEAMRGDCEERNIVPELLDHVGDELAPKVTLRLSEGTSETN